jgi:quercetin dioxygenase-like cupin family protein
MLRIVTIMLEKVSATPDLLVMEQAYASDATGPPPHYHPSQDEHFEVLEGSIAATIDGLQRIFTAGDAFDIPRGTVHTMGPHDGAARVRWEVRPALRTWEFLNEMPESMEGRIAHVGRHADEFRLAGA